MTTTQFTPPQMAAAVYQMCTTFDQYLPQLSPDVARSWAKVFTHSQLDIDDLLAGVEKVYQENGSGYRPLPADIARAGRAIRGDRAEREDRAALEARQERYDRKAADETRALAGVFVPGPVKNPTERYLIALDQLQACQGKAESQAAIREFFAAKREALRPRKPQGAAQ